MAGQETVGVRLGQPVNLGVQWQVVFSTRSTTSW